MCAGAAIATMKAQKSEFLMNVADNSGQTKTDEVGAVEDVVRPLLLVGGHDVIQTTGMGAMGQVFRARHLRLNREVAIKIILGGSKGRPNLLHRFRREAAIGAMLQHPNIAAVYDSGVVTEPPYQDVPWFSMEYIVGDSLREFLSATKPGIDDSVRLMVKIAEAMAYAHSRNVVHRDLKPDNIIVTAQGEPKVTDFGLAKVISNEQKIPTDAIRNPYNGHSTADREESVSGRSTAGSEATADGTQDGQTMGTLLYMAPEQALGQQDQVGPTADVYSLGCILYEMLTGTVPIPLGDEGCTVDRFRSLIPDFAIVPARIRNPQISADLSAVCMHCLNKEPQDRYPTARELADDLHRVLSRQSVIARPLNPVRRVLHWGRRNPVPIAVGVLLFASLLGTMVFAYLAVRAERLAVVIAEAERDSFLRAKQLRQVAKDAEAREHAARIRAEEELARSLTASTELLRLNGQSGWKKKAISNLNTVFAMHASTSEKALLRGLMVDVQATPDVYLHAALTQAEIMKSCGGVDAIRDVSFDPSGSKIFFSRIDAVVAQWDLTALPGADAVRSIVDRRPPTYQTENYSSQGAPMPCLLIAPDGHSALFPRWRGELGCFDARSKNVMSLELQDHCTVRSLATDGSGRLLLAGHACGKVGVYDRDTGLAFRMEATGQTNHWNPVAITTDGRLVAMTTATDLVVRDLTQEPEHVVCRFPIASGTLRSLEFLPDNHRLATAGTDGIARIYDVFRGKLDGVLVGHSGRINDISLSPDGRYVATASDDRTVRLWDQLTYEPILRRSFPSAALAVDFSPDSTLLAVAGDPVHVFRIESQACRQTVRPYDYSTEGLSFASDSSFFITTGADGEVTIRSCVNNRPSFAAESILDQTKPFDNGVQPLEPTLSPDSQWISLSQATYSNSSPRNFPVTLLQRRGEQTAIVKLADSPSRLTQTFFSSDSRFFVFMNAGGLVQCWNLKDAASVEWTQTIPVIAPAVLGPEGDSIVFPMRNGLRMVAFVNHRETEVLYPQGFAVQQVVAVPNANRWLLADRQGRMMSGVQLGHGLNVTWKPFAVESDGQSWSHLTASPDGQLLCGLRKEQICLWDLKTENLLLTLSLPGVMTGRARFSPDNRWLAVLPGDQRVELIDVQTAAKTLEATPLALPAGCVPVAHDRTGKSASERVPENSSAVFDSLTNSSVEKWRQTTIIELLNDAERQSLGTPEAVTQTLHRGAFIRSAIARLPPDGARFREDATRRLILLQLRLMKLQEEFHAKQKAEQTPADATGKQAPESPDAAATSATPRDD
ncbi:MAG: serine/threonine-protein kinase [Planctomycetaceae bacterium]